MMRWRKFGRVFVAAGQSEWLHTHGIVMIPRQIEGRVWRIYFSPRDRQNRSNVSWVNINLDDPTRVLRVSEAPTLQPGRIGCFDDSGSMGAWIVERGREEWLYYQGWTVPRTVAFHVSIGLAVRALGDLDAPFARLSEGPLMDRSRANPYFVANPAVLQDDAGTWRMWYQSGLPWQPSKSGPLPRYDIRHATSRDGIEWQLDETPALTFEHPGEVAIARFCPLREPDGKWRAFYSFRGDDWSYRLGTATSSDALVWRREDESVGLKLEEGTWERGSVSYPTVFDADGERWMLYNSGRYGDAGFGIAMLEQG